MIAVRAFVERRAGGGAEARVITGIDEAVIDRLVRTFYSRIRSDELLGPIFLERVGDWEPHLRQMNAFWASVVLSAGSYSGTPMRKHVGLPIEGVHFERWLALFEATATDVCGSEAAAIFLVRARRIAESLRIGVEHARGVLLP